MSDDASYSLRSRPIKMAGSGNGFPPFPPPSSSSNSSSRNPPHLPTPSERLILLVYPTLLVFGTLFSLVSPETRAAPYDAARHAHVQDSTAPSYFARKDNLLNVLFVKRGWAWITAAFAAFVLTHPAFSPSPSGGGGGGGGRTRSARRRLRAAARWALVTAWWILITQWCFGPPIIDRGFRFTGGRCEAALDAAPRSSGGHTSSGQDASRKDVFTAAACRAAGGRWSGGHDISGHVFLLVLGSFFLAQEVGWVVLRAAGGDRYLGQSGPGREERCVVMPDGAVKGAGVEAEAGAGAGAGAEGARDGEDAAVLGFGGKFAAAIIALCLWMLLMTAIYFHTWFEKLTGLLAAAVGIYAVYYVPRFVPAARAIVGLPGL